MTKVNYHQWINTILLAMLAFVANKYYDKVENAIDLVQAHQVEIKLQQQLISELKEKQGEQSVLLFHINEAILSDPFKKKRQ